MLTASEDLDFNAEDTVDPVLPSVDQNKGSKVSLHSTPCLDGFEKLNDIVPLENEDEGREKVNLTPRSFKTSLWSGNETATTRTIDSWDFPVGPIAWDDNDRPIERLLSYADLTLTEEEENGLLTDRIVAACSSYLTRSPGTKYHVVAKVSLNNKNLNDIRIISYHRFLQYVDLSWNNLTDLTPLGCLPYLMYLDVSHNLMEEVLRFRPPLNLTYVNYSYNEVWQIDDLTDFWALSYLDLSHNKISKIQGLHNLRYLRHLDLSHNKIERFENLRYLRITDLNLEYNLISKFESEPGYGLRALPHLVNVYLNNNLISTLEFLERAHTIKLLELQNNHISDLVELSHLKLLRKLRHLDISGNPVSDLKPYRSVILNFLQELKFLDQTEVKLSERAVTCKKKTFEVQLEAARNHARMVLLEHLNDHTLDLDVLPADQGTYPFVILVGPPGSNKREIMVQLGEKYPDKIHVAKLHTTREIQPGEENVLVHLSKEDFNEDIKAGKFMCVSELVGHLYGFSRMELAKAVKKHKLCLTSMNMVAALTVHLYGIQPFLVLTIPQSKEAHANRLKETYGPVLSLYGGAYIGERIVAETHSSNVKDVAQILESMLNNVMKIVSKSISKEPKSQASSVRNSATEKQEDSTGPLDPSMEPVNYITSSGCYACTSSKCGYQTSRIDKTDLSADGDAQTSSNNEVSKSTFTTDTEESSQKAETSYSASLPPDIKMDMSLSDGSSCGEENPFDDWSTPFIDWSEVNLTSMEREEAAELLCEKYIESIISTAEVYQNLHLENPGLFSLSVFTDDLNKAVKEVSKFLKDIWRTTPQRKPAFDVHNDLVYRAYAPKKVETLKQMLRKDFLSADGDCKSVAPIKNQAIPVLRVCNEMHLKGYGDFVEYL